jgi:hypothetical protein
MATKTNRKLAQCTCRAFEFGIADADIERDSTYTTGCIESTHSKFAMGHDAKLVGFMVRAELAGEEIYRIDGGMRITFAGAAQAAQTISDALALKAQMQLDAARMRIAKKEMRAAAKTARASKAKVEAPAAPVKLAPIEAMIKVGRWTYPAQIDRDTRVATYINAKGIELMAEEGRYSMV